MATPDFTQDPEGLFDQDFKAVIQGLKAIGQPLTSTLPHVLCTKMFHMDSKVRKAAKEALMAHAPPAISAHVKGDRRNYASMTDGKKMLKAIRGLEADFELDPALMARLLVRVMAVDRDLGRLQGGMTDQILLAALAYDENADYVFGYLSHAEKISLSLQGRLPRGLTDATSMQLLRLEGKLKRADHIESLVELPAFHALDLWVEGAQLGLWSPLKDKLEALVLRGAVSELESLEPLRGWSVLKKLAAGNTRIASIAPLAGKPLNYLIIGETQVQDHEVLLSLPGLEYLDVSRNKIEDPSVLGKLPRLSYLDASHVAGLELAFFEKHESLKVLQLWGQSFADLSALASTCVESVRFTHCVVEDLRPLVEAASLKSVDLTTARVQGDFSAADLRAARPDLLVYAR